MKKLLLSIFGLLIIISCSTSKQIERSVSVGNYDQAINTAVSKLRTNKDSRRKEDFIAMLQEAYYKANQRDAQAIAYLKQDNNPENHIKIYDLYVTLDNRQEQIKPLLPLYVDGQEAKLSMKNYASAIISSKDNASLHLYQNALALLNSKSNTKLEYRDAYQEFRTIEEINPNFRDVRQLIEVAHQKGTDFVLVKMTNDTQKVIPQLLEDDLLNFSTYGLNNLWAEYHNNEDDRISYDYTMDVKLREINTSPEQVSERQLVKEKEIVDGKQILRNENGDQVKDSLGNAIEVDKFKTVRCEYYEFKQFKTVQVTGIVEYYNINTKQVADAFPVSSQFIFEHIYATASGDRRALDTTLLGFLNQRAVGFPTEEQMIYDSGEDLKLQLKQIINSYTLN